MKFHSDSDNRLERLFSNHYGLVVSQALSFRPLTQDELDEYIQIASLAMITAYDKYDSEKAAFSTYAIQCIRNAIKNHLREITKHRHVKLAEYSYDETESIDDILPDLTEEEKRIILLKVMGYSVSEISSETNSTKHRVKNVLYKLYKKIREANEKDSDGK